MDIHRGSSARGSPCRPGGGATSTFWACFTATRFALGLVPDLRPLTALAWSHVAALSALATLATYWSTPGDASGGWALDATGVVGAAPARLFPNGIAQGSRMFNLTGLRQALFELGAATGASRAVPRGEMVRRERRGVDDGRVVRGYLAAGAVTPLGAVADACEGWRETSVRAGTVVFGGDGAGCDDRSWTGSGMGTTGFP